MTNQKLLTRKYFEEYITFNDYIEFRVLYWKIKLLNGRYLFKSYYARDIDQAMQIVEKFGHNKNTCLYVGVNTRKKMSKNDADIDERRVFYFDVEAKAPYEKKPITDEEYKQKLLDTIDYISYHLKQEGIELNMVRISGRGMVASVKIKPLSRIDYDEKFKQWWKQFIAKTEQGRPHEDVGYFDSVFNIGRIVGCPYSYHTKYEENPFREILFMKIHENDMQPILDKIKVVNYQPVMEEVDGSYKKLYDSDEWKLIERGDLPEGKLHNTLLLQIKIMLRDYELDPEPVQMRLYELGFNEKVDTPPRDVYVRSKKTVAKWCLEFYEYCIDNNFYSKNKYYPDREWFENEEEKTHIKKVETQVNAFLKNTKLVTHKDVITYILAFHEIASVIVNNRLYVFGEYLKEKIKEQTDKKFFEYLVKSGELQNMIGKWKGTRTYHYVRGKLN